DNRLRDFMFVVRGELAKSESVVIIDIDEQSLKEYGQWPWQPWIWLNILVRNRPTFSISAVHHHRKRLEMPSQYCSVMRMLR
ncbi:MAG TPA: CHASE2 domain-containing protein, partial [bacterium (Candidatus Stahlbacteria)]|nr:CHASE2 domain-containing protein [Candidatus Stahlbacteria bacterium]